MNSPSLPALLPFSGNWSEWAAFIDTCYQVFRDTLMTPPRPRFRDRMVHVDDFVGQQDEGRERIFWHLTTKDHPGGGRDPDPNRAVRVNWIRVLIENHSQFKTWRYLEVKEKAVYRWYIWAEQHDFLVILEEKKNRYQLITSFWVEEWNREKLNKKHEKRES